MVFLFDTSSFSVRGLPVGMSLAGEGPGELPAQVTASSPVE